MRLLFVSHSFPPPGRPLRNIGGMQRVATELCDALAEHEEVEVQPLVLRTSWRWTHLRAVPFALRALWKINQAARREAIDAVLFSSMVTAALAVPLRGRLAAAGIRTAAIVHGRDVTLATAPYQRFIKHVFDALDLVLPVSRATGKQCLLRGLAQEKMHVVPNGIRPDRFAAPADRGEARRVLQKVLGEPGQGLPDDALLLCSVGRQVKRKGFAWFTEFVMPRLPESVHYWLAGEGPEATEIAAAAHMAGVGHRVRQLGRVSERQLAQLYRGADLFTMPNIPVSGDMEGFGVVMLEAGLCGLPTVAARLEGITDVVEEGVNGHLVETGDVSGFTDVVSRYHRDREALRAASSRAAEHVRDTFSWRAIADRYVAALQNSPAEVRAAV